MALVHDDPNERDDARPLPIAEAWSLLSPEATLRLDDALWSRQAQTFFDLELHLAAPPRFFEGGERATFALDLTAAGVTTRVVVVTFPIGDAPHVIYAANQGVFAIGGAGMDALVARAKRAFQVRTAIDCGDARAPLAVAAVLASVLLAPIVPPTGDTIFGVRGARLRLEQAGWG